MKTWQSYLRDAAIVALDQSSVRLVEQAGETAVHRLAKQWHSLKDDEKRELIEIAVAVGGAITLAATAFREAGPKKKKKAKKIAKAAGKKVLKKVAARTAGLDLKKAKKK